MVFVRVCMCVNGCMFSMTEIDDRRESLGEGGSRDEEGAGSG